MHLQLAARSAAAGSLALALGVGFSAAAEADPGANVAGHVYEATNAAGGNAIQVFDRSADGHLATAATVSTGGSGSGGSLHSQGGVTRAGDLLFVVNAGSNSVSALEITTHGLVLRDTVSSGGALPVSVTVRAGIGYVVNQTSDTISGFHYSDTGHLSPLQGSTKALTPNPSGGITDAAQISFTPDGSTLVVTEKASNALDTFTVTDEYASGPVSHPSAGTTPYGFDFDPRGHAVVSEASSGSASSYAVGRRGFSLISSAVSNTQAAACWLVVSRGYAWVVNAASGTVSSYAIAPDGSLTLVKAVAATTGPGGTDAALSQDGRSLHVRMGAGVVSSWAINRDGSLSTLGTTQGAASFGTAGLAAS